MCVCVNVFLSSESEFGNFLLENNLPRTVRVAVGVRNCGLSM